MFEEASKLGLRFESPKGHLTTEDLWDIPLVSDNPMEASLDTIARSLCNKLPNDGTEGDDITQLMYDIVSHTMRVRLGKALTELHEKEKLVNTL